MDNFILGARVGLLAVNVAFFSLLYWMLHNGTHPAVITVMGVVFNLVCVAVDLRMLYLCKNKLTPGVFTIATVGWYLFNLISFTLLPFGKELINPR